MHKSNMKIRTSIVCSRWHASLSLKIAHTQYIWSQLVACCKEEFGLRGKHQQIQCKHRHPESSVQKSWGDSSGEGWVNIVDDG